MPATSIRDLVVHNDDVVVGTHGRSFWILDDVTPLRQASAGVAASPAHLFRPQVAYRVRWNVNTDTPLPPEEPAGQNPPDGAILNYHLKEAAPGPVTLEVYDSAKRLVRRFSSDDKPEPVNERELVIDPRWVRPHRPLPAQAGMQRFVWDLHYPPPEGARRSYPMTAVYHDTPSAPRGPWVLPGEYTVKLTVNGRSQEQPLTVKMDPRVQTPPEGLAKQHAIAMLCWDGGGQVQAAMRQVRTLRAQLRDRRERVKDNGDLSEALTALDRKAAALEGAGGGRRGGGGRFVPPGVEGSLNRLSFQLLALMALVEGADATPTAQAVAASEEVRRALAAALARWAELKDRDLKAVNGQLDKAKLPAVTLAP
jgi:hypothetical protein